MKQPKGKIDWITTTDDEAWQASQSASHAEQPTQRGLASNVLHRKEAALAALLVVILPLVIGLWLARQPSAPAATPNPQQDALIHTGQFSTPVAQPADKQEPTGIVKRVGERVMTQVIAYYPEEGKMRPYRESHFYERSAAEWQRIPPDPALTGPQKSLTVANFTIHYQAADAGAVYEAAPKLQQFYATLRHDLGLPAADGRSTITIEVTIDQGQRLNFDYLKRTLSVSSPLLLSAPVEMTPGTLLYLGLPYSLTRLTLLERIEQHDSLWKSRFTQWPSMPNAIALWELWEDSGPLASGRQQTIQWLYQNAKMKSMHTTSAVELLPDGPLPDEYNALCRTYRIWQIMPSDAALPFTCTDRDKEMLAAMAYPYLASELEYPVMASIWLGQGGYGVSSEAYRAYTVSATLTTETIIEYIVTTYGRDKLTQFIEALGEYPTLETLIPALFGVSKAGFAAGWQAYLAEHY